MQEDYSKVSTLKSIDRIDYYSYDTLLDSLIDDEYYEDVYQPLKTPLGRMNIKRILKKSKPSHNEAPTIKSRKRRPTKRKRIPSKRITTTSPAPTTTTTTSKPPVAQGRELDFNHPFWLPTSLLRNYYQQILIPKWTRQHADTIFDFADNRKIRTDSFDNESNRAHIFTTIKTPMNADEIMSQSYTVKESPVTQLPTTKADEITIGISAPWPLDLNLPGFQVNKSSLNSVAEQSTFAINRYPPTIAPSLSTTIRTTTKFNIFNIFKNKTTTMSPTIYESSLTTYEKPDLTKPSSTESPVSSTTQSTISQILNIFNIFIKKEKPLEISERPLVVQSIADIKPMVTKIPITKKPIFAMTDDYPEQISGILDIYKKNEKQEPSYTSVTIKEPNKTPTLPSTTIKPSDQIFSIFDIFKKKESSTTILPITNSMHDKPTFTKEPLTKDPFLTTTIRSTTRYSIFDIFKKKDELEISTSTLQPSSTTQIYYKPTITKRPTSTIPPTTTRISFFDIFKKKEKPVTTTESSISQTTIANKNPSHTKVPVTKVSFSTTTTMPSTTRISIFNLFKKKKKKTTTEPPTTTEIFSTTTDDFSESGTTDISMIPENDFIITTEIPTTIDDEAPSSTTKKSKPTKKPHFPVISSWVTTRRTTRKTTPKTTTSNTTTPKTTQKPRNATKKPPKSNSTKVEKHKTQIDIITLTDHNRHQTSKTNLTTSSNHTTIADPAHNRTTTTTIITTRNFTTTTNPKTKKKQQISETTTTNLTVVEELRTHINRKANLTFTERLTTETNRTTVSNNFTNLLTTTTLTTYKNETTSNNMKNNATQSSTMVQSTDLTRSTVNLTESSPPLGNSTFRPKKPFKLPYRPLETSYLITNHTVATNRNITKTTDLSKSLDINNQISNHTVRAEVIAVNTNLTSTVNGSQTLVQNETLVHDHMTVLHFQPKTLNMLRNITTNLTTITDLNSSINRTGNMTYATNIRSTVNVTTETNLETGIITIVNETIISNLTTATNMTTNTTVTMTNTTMVTHFTRTEYSSKYNTDCKECGQIQLITPFPILTPKPDYFVKNHSLPFIYKPSAVDLHKLQYFYEKVNHTMPNVTTSRPHIVVPILVDMYNNLPFIRQSPTRTTTTSKAPTDEPHYWWQDYSEYKYTTELPDIDDIFYKDDDNSIEEILLQPLLTNTVPIINAKMSQPVSIFKQLLSSATSTQPTIASKPQPLVENIEGEPDAFTESTLYHFANVNGSNKINLTKAFSEDTNLKNNIYLENGQDIFLDSSVVHPVKDNFNITNTQKKIAKVVKKIEAQPVIFTESTFSSSRNVDIFNQINLTKELPEQTNLKKNINTELDVFTESSVLHQVEDDVLSKFNLSDTDMNKQKKNQTKFAKLSTEDALLNLNLPTIFSTVADVEMSTESINYNTIMEKKSVPNELAVTIPQYVGYSDQEVTTAPPTFLTAPVTELQKDDIAVYNKESIDSNEFSSVADYVTTEAVYIKLGKATVPSPSPIPSKPTYSYDWDIDPKLFIKDTARSKSPFAIEQISVGPRRSDIIIEDDYYDFTDYMELSDIRKIGKNLYK